MQKGFAVEEDADKTTSDMQNFMIVVDSLYSPEISNAILFSMLPLKNE